MPNRLAAPTCKKSRRVRPSQNWDAPAIVASLSISNLRFAAA
jgi:hypothetical protein